MTFLGRRFGSAGILLGALAALAPAQAQDFSSRPIRMIVGLAPGGGTDVQARLVAQKLAENMKTTVVVENKPGGNFIPAARELAGSPPDGHTLYFISASSLITQAVHPDYPVDLLKFTPVTEVSTGPLILVARNDLGGLPPRGKADEFHVLVMVAEIAKVQIHGASFMVIVTASPSVAYGSVQPPPSAR